LTSEIGASPTAATVIVRHDDRFAWDDAGIGAGAAIAVLLIIAGGAGLAITRRAHRLGGAV
jgi:hypothetical protein